MAKLSVTVIAKNEADHIARALESVAWADERIVVDSQSTDDTVAIARRFTDRVVVREWPGYIEQKNYAASLASHDWILSLDADECVTPALADEIRAVLSGAPAAKAYRIPRVTWHLGRWIRTTDWYPDHQLRLYDRRSARWVGRYVHEAVSVDGPVGTLKGELQHFPYKDISEHLETINTYTTYAARQMRENGQRSGLLQIAGHPPLAFLRNYVAKGGIRDGAAGFIISTLNAYYVFLKYAKLWSLSRDPKPDSPKPEARSPKPMFSLHIDTARTWRGGQNQVLLTVNGLREIGDRTALVAHPDGELRRRAAEGLELIPIAPRTELDLSAAWRLSRVIKRLNPDVIHAHDPHGVAMASLALSIGSSPQALIASRRVDFHLKKNSFSRWKHRQVDCFIAASEAIRQMLVADGVPPEQTVTVHEGIDLDHVLAAPPVNVHETFWLPHHAPLVGNIAALVPHKGQRHLVEAAHLVVQEIPDARFVILGEGELREPLEHLVRDYHLEKHVLLPGFRTDVLGCLKGFDLFVMSSVTEGLGTSLLDAMACSKAVVASRVGGIPEVVDDGRTGLLVAPRDHHGMAAAIVRLLRDVKLRREMGEAGLARFRERFTVERMVAETAAVYRRVAGRPHGADTESRSASR